MLSEKLFMKANNIWEGWSIGMVYITIYDSQIVLNGYLWHARLGTVSCKSGYCLLSLIDHSVNCRLINSSYLEHCDNDF